MAVLRSLTKFSQFIFTTHTPTPNPTTLRTLISSPPSFHGPLFLSYPPWKLLLSATPLYYQSDVVVSPDFHRRERKFSLKLGLELLKNSGRDFDNRKDSEIVGSSCDGGFVNWPNFISITRLLSGPVLGWMIMHDMYLPAFLGLVVSGATDWMDMWPEKWESILWLVLTLILLLIKF